MLLDHMWPDPYEMMRIIHAVKKTQKELYKMKLTFELCLMIIKGLYPIMRPILLEAIDDPEKMWDDYLMDLFDHAFGKIKDGDKNGIL